MRETAQGYLHSEFPEPHGADSGHFGRNPSFTEQYAGRVSSIYSQLESNGGNVAGMTPEALKAWEQNRVHRGEPGYPITIINGDILRPRNS